MRSQWPRRSSNGAPNARAAHKPSHLAHKAPMSYPMGLSKLRFEWPHSTYFASCCCSILSVSGSADLCAQGQAPLHLMQSHFEVDLRPHERRVVIRLPLPLGQVVSLATHPRAELTIVPRDRSQGTSKKELLQAQQLWLLRLLVQLAVVGTHHGIKETPLRFLTWL